MRRLILFAFLCLPIAAQTPTFVQGTFPQNSGGADAGAGWNGSCANGTTISYCVQFPEATLVGNMLVCESVAAATSTYAIKDDQSGTWTKANSSNFPFTSASSNVYNLWYQANNPGGIRRVTVTSTANNTGFEDLKCQEYYNVALTSPVDGTANCHTVTSTTATGVTTGTLTTGDLIVFSTDSDNQAAIASFTASSQTNWAAALVAVDRLEGYAVQAGVYSSTTAFTPQITTGTSNPFTSCQVALKAASAGTAPTQALRIDNLGHFQFPNSTATRTVQFPSLGNLIVIAFAGGGDCPANTGNSGCATSATTTGITSSPSNTWACAGTVSGASANNVTAQICYAANASTGSTMTISITRNVNGGSLTQDAIDIYDVIGANTTPFDLGSGGQSGNQASVVTTLTTCTACLTPGTASGVVFYVGQWNFETAIAQTAPSGGFFDAAVTNFRDVNGPQPVDQNGGFGHFYNTTTGSVTVTWTMANDATNAVGPWAGYVAHFKAPLSASGTMPPVVF